MIYTYLDVTHAMRSNKQHQDRAFPNVRMVYFPGTLHCCLEGLIYNFASKVVFLLGKPFPLFYFILSALNNNSLQFFPWYPHLQCVWKKRKLILVYLLELHWPVTPCYELWKYCQSELVAFTNLKQFHFKALCLPSKVIGKPVWKIF